MHQIGSGLEYKVYDQGDGRVLKVRRSLPNRLFASFRYAVRSRNFRNWPGIVRILLPKVNGIPPLVSRLAGASLENKRLFGNIALAGGNDYAQDLVTSLRDYFATHSLEENVAVAVGYVRLIQSLWEIGVGDPYYNFQFNAGVYSDGSVAQIDVADLIVDRDVLGATVRRQIWLETGVASVADKRLRDECARLFNAGFTCEGFLERWPKAGQADSAAMAKAV